MSTERNQASDKGADRPRAPLALRPTPRAIVTAVVVGMWIAWAMAFLHFMSHPLQSGRTQSVLLYLGLILLFATGLILWRVATSERTKLRTKLILAMGVLTIIAVAATSLVLTAHSVKTVINQAESMGTAIASFVARTAAFTWRIPNEFEKALGEQMVVEAKLAAHLVAIAESRANMNPDEINAVLKDIADRSALGEVWITDENGHAYLHSKPESDFTFPKAGEGTGQAQAFWPLLEQRDGTVVQETLPRELDGNLYKYVGVSGVDKPRIVQVGYDPWYLSRVGDQLNLDRSLGFLRTVEGLRQTLIFDERGEAFFTLDDSDLDAWNTNDQMDRRKQMLDSGSVAAGLVNLEAGVSCYEVIVPFDASAEQEGGVAVLLDTAFIEKGVAGAVRWGLIVFLGAIVASYFIAHSIAKPIADMAASSRLIREGKLDVRLELPKGAEARELAETFNRTVASLGEYVGMLWETTLEKQQIESELSIATKLQQSILPRELPLLEKVDIAGLSQPARHVGGDFYDFVPMGPGKIGFVIGDAAAKDLRSALLAVESWGIIRALAIECDEVSEILNRANPRIVEKIGDTDLFLTVSYSVIDVDKLVVHYASAGHNPTLVVRAGRQPLEFLEATGFPLGIMPDPKVTTEVAKLEAGDIMAYHTDGLSEAMNDQLEPYGMERFKNVVLANADRSASDIVQAIRDAVFEFTAGAPQIDDITVVVVKML